METQRIRLSQLKLDLKNLRGHGEEEIDLLVKSLTVFGQFKPLIVDRGTMEVKIGNGRLMAMRKMGWTECDCILTDFNGKDGMEVIDNRLNEMSSWQESDLKKWFNAKGREWWGIDELIASKVEKMTAPPKNDGKRDGEKEPEPEMLCPCCGKPLVRKSRLILD